jgi:hypothetical protein
VSQCCGDAGMGDFFLALDGIAASGGPAGEALVGKAVIQDAAEFARHLGSYIVGEGSLSQSEANEGPRGEGGINWPQAEHRTRPDFIQAQTGWMQGAAGVGAFFLHLDGLAKGRKARITLPDSPWGGLI